MAQLDKDAIIKCLEMDILQAGELTSKQISKLLIREGFEPNKAIFSKVDPKKGVIVFSQ